MCQILSLSQGTKNHVWVLNQQGLASVHGSNICFLQQFQKQTKQNKTTLCASEKKFLFPSDYLLAVAPHNTTNSMIISYPLAPFIIWSQCPHCEPTKRPTQSVFQAIQHWKIPGLVKVALAQCQEFFGGKWVREDKGESVQSECCSLCAIYIPWKQTKKLFFCFFFEGEYKTISEGGVGQKIMKFRQPRRKRQTFFSETYCVLLRVILIMLQRP